MNLLMSDYYCRDGHFYGNTICFCDYHFYSKSLKPLHVLPGKCLLLIGWVIWEKLLKEKENDINFSVLQSSEIFVYHDTYIV